MASKTKELLGFVAVRLKDMCGCWTQIPLEQTLGFLLISVHLLVVRIGCLG